MGGLFEVMVCVSVAWVVTDVVATFCGWRG